MRQGSNPEPVDHDKRPVPDIVWYILSGLMVLVGVWVVVVYVPEKKFRLGSGQNSASTA
jgi:hypothetical protein